MLIGFINKMNNKDFNQRLISAVDAGRWKTVEDLFYSSGKSSINSITDKDGFTLLCIAAYKGHYRLARYLLTCGACVNSATLKDGYTALHVAVNANNTEIVKLLLDNGANVNAKCKNGETPLHSATQRGYFKMTKLLLKHGADPNCSYNTDVRKSKIRAGYTPLHLAAKFGYKKIVQLLIGNGAVMNTLGEDSEGRLLEANALHIACEEGKIEVVKVLIKSDADVNFKDSKSNTALHFAAKSRCSGIIYFLLKSSADIEAKDETGRTALHIAAETDLVDNVETLLMYGADIESTDVRGRTPLHIASQYFQAEVAMMLLKYGSDINSISLDNYTPFHLAVDSFADFEKNWENIFKCTRLWMSNNFNKVDIVYLMYEHIVKMKVANLYVCELNLKLVERASPAILLEGNCEKEMKRLKCEKITYNVTLHDIITKGMDKLVKYVEIKTVYKFLTSSDYEESFPIYASLIKSRFRLCVERKELVKQCYSYFYLTRKMPSECADKILCYLTNRDMKLFILAFKYGNIGIHSNKELHT